MTDADGGSCMTCGNLKRTLYHLDNGNDGYFCYEHWAYVHADKVNTHTCNEWKGYE